MQILKIYNPHFTDKASLDSRDLYLFKTCTYF